MGKCQFNPDWLSDSRFAQWLVADPSGDKNKFSCKFCQQSFVIGTSGIKALNSHMSSQKHSKSRASVANSRSILKFASKSNTQQSTSHSHSQANNTVTTSLSATQSTLKVSDNDVLKAEILWTLHVISSHSSARSSVDMGPLFKVMFAGHPVAEKFKCSRTKLGYLSTFGIAPAIRSQILATVKSVDNYVVMFDESMNPDMQKKQLDVHVRFMDVDGTVQTRYIDSYFLGHATAAHIVSKLKDTMSNVQNDNLLQISMDGPNVNWKVFKDVSSLLNEEGGKSLINIGSCPLHVFHNSIKAGLKESGWEIDTLLRSLHFLFQDSPARREDFLTHTGSTMLPLKFCGHRWLENIPAAERAIAIWPFIMDYIKKAKKGEITEPMCKTFKVLLDHQGDKLIIAKLHSFVFICKILRPFLLKFQRDEPLVPFLAKEISAVVKQLYSLILKDGADDVDDLVAPSNVDSQSFKPYAKIEVGCHAEKILTAEKKKLSELQIMDFRLSFQKLVKACVKKIIEKSPLNFRFTKTVACFDPALITSNSAKAKDLLKATANHLQLCGWITPEEVDSSLIQFSTFKEAICKHPFATSDRLDTYFTLHGSLENVPALGKILKMVLVLSHGNAEVERGFSVNKEVTVENLLEETLVARRLLCQFVHNKSIAEIVISKEMLLSCSRAWQRYSEAMELKKKEAEMSEEKLKRKRKNDEIKDLVSKRRKVELDMDMLVEKADALNERAEGAGAKLAHDMIVQSNALRREARVKKDNMKELSSLIVEKEEELKLL